MNLYCISFPNKKRYFGIETIEGARWRSHKCSAKAGENLPLYKAMRKHGIKNCKFLYIYKDIPKEYAIKLEIQFIKSYKTTDHSFGYNVSPGGDHWIPGKKTRNKISKSVTKHYASLTPQQRKDGAAHLKARNTGCIRSKSFCEKASISAKKRKSTPAYRKLLSDRKKAWWAARKASGLIGNIAYTRNPSAKPTPKPKVQRERPYQRLRPVTDEHRAKVSQAKKEWWAKKKANGQTNWSEVFGKPKKAGYTVTLTDAHKENLSIAASNRQYQTQEQS